MSNHQKRLAAPDSWPIERKTEKFTTKAGAGPHGEDGVPLLVLLRDVLGYVDSKKEARYALDQDSVLVNGEPASDERRPIGMFDILAFTEREEFYRVFPGEGGRLALTPIDADAAESKLGKITGKHDVPGGDSQLALHDGETLLVEDAGEYGGGDSIVIENESDEIVAHFPYEEGALVTATRGTHAGEIGEIETIQVTPGSAKNNVQIEQAEGGFETIADYVVVIDENFVEEEEETVGADVPAEAADERTEAAADETTETENNEAGGEENDEAGTAETDETQEESDE